MTLTIKMTNKMGALSGEPFILKGETEMTKKEIRVRILNLQIERAEILTSILGFQNTRDLGRMQANVEHQNRYFDQEIHKLLEKLNS